MNKSSGPYMQQAGRGNMEKTGRGIPMEFQGPAMHEPGHDGPDPNLSESERKIVDSDQLSDARAQELKGLRGSAFRDKLNALKKQQRAADSSYIVNNRTVQDYKPVKQSQGEQSSSVLSPQGPSRPSQFRRDKDGNLEKY